MRQNYKITIQYDGTHYHGWQIQSNGRTIQGELTRVLSLLDHRHVTIHGAGRTDAGVHARGQVANFFLEREFDPRGLRDAINGNLDRDIRVITAGPVDDSFNARFSAKLKTYHYRIWTGPVVSPFLYRYVYHYNGQLDVEQMRSAAADLVGAHDFSAFTSLHTPIEDRRRTMKRLDIEEREDCITLVAQADGFLRYMVRTIAGTLVEVGRGRRAASSVAEILHSRNRANAGAMLAAAGLTLMRVDY